MSEDRTDEDREAQPGEERFEYADGSVAFQRPCPDCDKGLLYAPVRFHAACGGSGYLVRWVQSA